MVSIANGQILQGHLGKTAQRLVSEWTSQYREELFADWERAANKQPLEKIPPFE